MNGLVERSSEFLHARKGYQAKQVLFDRDYVDIVRWDIGGGHVDRLFQVPPHARGWERVLGRPLNFSGRRPATNQRTGRSSSVAAFLMTSRSLPQLPKAELSTRLAVGSRSSLQSPLLSPWNRAGTPSRRKTSEQQTRPMKTMASSTHIVPPRRQGSPSESRRRLFIISGILGVARLRRRRASLCPAIRARRAPGNARAA